jgi:hypothetical protein
MANYKKEFDTVKYQKFKKLLASKALDFNNLDDLCLLADVYLLSHHILRNNKFPIKKYKLWQNSQKKK